MPTINKLERKKREYYSDKRKDRQSIYNSKRWHELRRIKVLNNPVCERCLLKEIVTPVQDVHHIDSFMRYQGVERLEKAFDYDNLMSLCRDCHTAIHNDKNETIWNQE